MTIELIPKNLDVRSGQSTPIVFLIIGDKLINLIVGVYRAPL